MIFEGAFHPKPFHHSSGWFCGVLCHPWCEPVTCTHGCREDMALQDRHRPPNGGWLKHYK